MVLGRFLSSIPEWLTVTRVTLGKSRMDKFFNHYSRRTLTTIPPTSPPNEDDRSPRRRKLVAAFGAALAASGLALAYRAYSEDLKIEYKAQCAEDCQKCEDSQCLRKMDKEEEMIAKANQELEKALKDVKPKAQTATEAALKVTEVTRDDIEKRFQAYCEASDLIKLFMDKAYCAIENDNLDSPQFEEVWCDVYETAVKRCEKVKDAMNKGQCAWELLCRLREIIENGKNCKYTQCNPLLITAEETLLCAERELLNAKNRMDCIQSESRLVEQYRNLVEDFRRDLKAELESLLASEDCKSTLTENECAMILTHAYKKVLRVQKELAQVQDDSTAADTITSSVLVQKIDEVRKFYEQDLIKALSRQAQALQENYETAKQAAYEEYERRLKQNTELTEAEILVDLRSKYSHATAALAAMKEALEERHTEDIQSEKFKKLWAYCSTVYNRINYADFVADDITSDKIVIDKKTLLQDFSDDEFVKVLLKSIPEEVGSAESLRQRFFNKVDKVCRRVAVFKDDESITLWKYFLGVLQESLTTRCEGESEDKDTYAILDRTGLFLRRGDLLEAVCTLNNLEAMRQGAEITNVIKEVLVEISQQLVQYEHMADKWCQLLKNCPGVVARRICRDWLADARAVLEANQTLFALMTHATSNNLH